MNRIVSSLCGMALAGFVMQAALAADAGAPADKDPAKAAEKTPEAKVFVTHHKGRVGATSISYTATAGTMLMKNDKDEPVALFGFTAYARDDADKRTRPIVFAYNGGPGSASAWLHMGILGPKRTVLDDLVYNTHGPFRMVENEYSILDVADLVMIDPIGTGFSRPIGKGEGKDFWGVDQDVTSVSDFIVQYLSEYGRWASPKFILGESYGGMRTGGVSFALLTRHNVALNGVILVSPFMDVGAGFAGLRIDEPYINFLSTYAATAWYQRVLKDRPEQLQPFLREVEAFSEDVYAPVLFKGTRATAAERQTVLAGLERYTGISAAYWDKANLRLDEGQFLQELMRSKGKVIGRIDSRYVGDTIDPLGESMDYDPYSAAVAPAIVATFNAYYREDLKVESDREYILSGRLWKHWDNSHAQPDMQGGKSPLANTAVDLAQALTMNPKMQVLIQQGYFDLAVPYRTIQYVVEHLDVAPELRANVHFEYYDAGHMMYVHPPSMKKFKDTTAEFIRSNTR